MKRLLKEALRMGCEVEFAKDNITPGAGEIRVTAPDGYWFSDIGVHEIVCCYGPEELCLTKREAVSGVLLDIEGDDNLVECDQADCEWCEDAYGGE